MTRDDELTDTIRIVIADDHAVVRRGLRPVSYTQLTLPTTERV
jgi:hypothetical protein